MKLKLGSCLFACAVALLCVGGAYADGVSSNDSHVTVGRDGPNPTLVAGSFTDAADSLGGGKSFFVNNTNQEIVKLILTTTEFKKADFVNCSNPTVANQIAFGNCSVNCPSGQCKKGVTASIIFSDPLNGGIAPHEVFFINLNTPGKDGGGWKGNAKHQGNGVGLFSVDPIFESVPEPGSLLLVLAGLGGASLFRRFRRS